MDKQRQISMQQAIALADLCELLSVAFRFPTAELACALADGGFADDARNCLVEAGFGTDEAERACALLDGFAGADARDLFAELRKGYSLLFLAPGADVPVWPYEAAFRHVAEHKQGAPMLFRAPITLNVEHMMAEAGVRPTDARKEPADSVADEFAFLSYLYGKAAEAQFGAGESHIDEGGSDDAWQGDDEPAFRTDGAGEALAEDALVWLFRARSFFTCHPACWLGDFMAQVTEAAAHVPYSQGYAALAALGQAALRLLAEDAQRTERL